MPLRIPLDFSKGAFGFNLKGPPQLFGFFETNPTSTLCPQRDPDFEPCRVPAKSPFDGFKHHLAVADFPFTPIAKRVITLYQFPPDFMSRVPSVPSCIEEAGDEAQTLAREASSKPESPAELHGCVRPFFRGGFTFSFAHAHA